MQIYKYSNKQINKFPYLKFIIKYLSFIWIFIICLFVYSVQVHAQDVTSITVFPAVQDVKVTPGEKTRAQVTFYNRSDQVTVGDVKVADFVVVDKQGKTEIIEDPKLKPKYSASSWVRLSDDFIAIPKNESVGLNLFITPPNDLTSCGYYALVYFQPNPGVIKRLGAKTESASAITSKIGAILNFTVQGKQCQELVSITNLSAPFFSEYGPVPVTLDLLNNGDIHLSPKGTVFATNVLGAYVDQQSLKELRIFPERTKEYQLTLGGKWMLGRYKIVSNISYGQTPKTASAIAYVWVFPWRVALLVALTLIVLYLLVKSAFDRMNKKEAFLEKEIEEEKEEIEKLREALKKRQE